MAYLIKVMVVDKKTKRGLEGYRVKTYSGKETKTDKNGMANLIVEDSRVTVYVNGTEVYDGYTYNAPDPIIYEM